MAGRTYASEATGRGEIKSQLNKTDLSANAKS